MVSFQYPFSEQPLIQSDLCQNVETMAEVTFSKFMAKTASPTSFLSSIGSVSRPAVFEVTSKVLPKAPAAIEYPGPNTQCFKNSKSPRHSTISLQERPAAHEKSDILTLRRNHADMKSGPLDLPNDDRGPLLRAVQHCRHVYARPQNHDLRGQKDISLSSRKMTARMILQLFEQYQKARSHFVQMIADLASRQSNVECLHTAGVLDLLKPLLVDMVPSIRLGAAVALGRMANADEKIAKVIVRNDVLPLLLRGLENQTKHHKKAILFIMRSISKHNPEMANVVIQSGGLDAAIVCLEDFDQGVKESAVWLIDYIARHSASHAQVVVEVGAVPLLVLCIQEPDLCLKQVAASSFSDIAKHSLRLATSVVDAGAIPYLAKALSNVDTKLKKQVLMALANISKHSTDLAELVVEAEIFPDALVHLSHPDDEVKKTAATLVREIAKHSLELAQLIVNTGGIAALLEEIASTKNSTRLPAIMAVGYICAHNDQLALAVINAKGLLVLSEVLCSEVEDHILAAVVWAIGQCGKHSPEHASCVAVCQVFCRLLQLYNCEESSEDLKLKCKCTLKQVLQKTLDVSALEQLLDEAPPNIIKYVLGQFSKILPNDPRARRSFVASGALRKVQTVEAEPGSTLMEYITIINCCFPEEVVVYYSPGYPDSLLERVEHFSPQIPPLLGSSRQSSEEEVLENVTTGEEDSQQPCMAII